MIVKKAANRSQDVYNIRTSPDGAFFRRLVGLTFMIVVVLVAVFPAAAQEPTKSITDDEVNSVAKELFCPICENTPLDVCETQACADWRQVIRDKLSGGQSEEQIKDYFADQYGVRALAEPPAEGVTLLVWLVPLIAIPAAFIIFALYLRNIRRSAPAPRPVVVSHPAVTEPDASDPDEDPYAARIERELREM
jgi:cytochrome c-type biogenesis protein CcmH